MRTAAAWDDALDALGDHSAHDRDALPATSLVWDAGDAGQTADAATTASV